MARKYFLISLLVALLSAIIAPTAVQAVTWAIPFSARSEKGIVSGTAFIKAELLCGNRKISTADLGGTMFPLPANYAGAVGRIYLRMSAEGMVFKKDGTPDATLKVSREGGQPKELIYTKGLGWCFDLDLSMEDPGLKDIEFDLRYRAGRDYRKINLFLFDMTIDARNGSQQRAISALIPVVGGAPSDPTKLVQWQKLVRASAADGIIPLECSIPIEQNISVSLDRDMVSDDDARQAFARELAKEDDKQVATDADPWTITVQNGRIRIYANRFSALSIDFGAKYGSKRYMHRTIKPGDSKTLDYGASGLTFTLSSEGVERVYNSRGEEVR